MLDSRELADMRETFRRTCDKVCIISDPGEPIPGPGGETPGAATETSRLCRAMDLVGSEREVGGRLSGVADVRILLEWGPVPDWDASLTIGENTYDIVRVTSGDGTQPVAVEVYGQRTD